MHRSAIVILLLIACHAIVASAAEPSVVKVGAGAYAAALPAGAKGPQAEIYATASAPKQMPTNDWWSSLAWLPLSERHYAHPLALQAVERGLQVYYPGNNITANRDAIFGFMPAGNGEDLVLGHSAQKTFTEARVQRWSDWFVTVQMGEGDRRMALSYGHGSPFVYARYTGGQPTVTFKKVPAIFSGDAKSAVLGIKLGGKAYALFAPPGATWLGQGTNELRCVTKDDYLSLAILPDDRPETLALFQQYAYNHVFDSKVAWKFDQASSQLITTYEVTTENLPGSTSDGTLLALYPHQWRHTNDKLLESGYDSVRGRMKLLAGSGFSTTYRFSGVLPALPKVETTDAAELSRLLRVEVSGPLGAPKDTYWEGKMLGKLASLIPLAEQFDQQQTAEELRNRVRTRLEAWLSARPGQATGMFAYDANWGTLIGYPASYGSDVELNDHHFHYGYFIRAAAEIARTDPKWAARDHWGGMIDLLIRDIASADRQDPLFPFLRNFDPYAGHSWASGHAKFGDGNNNESSSEAMNAWYGMILWGEFTGDTKTRDLGIYLYTTEMQAIQEYWFDVRDENHPPGFTPSVVTMVWGGKGANATWFTANPEAVHGINWLPIHGGSLYLGHHPHYVRKNYEALLQENGGANWDEWADIVWMYQAMYDAPSALRQYQAARDTVKVEGGNSLANAYHWISSFQALGTVNAEVTANAPLFAVFDNRGERTYVVYNNKATVGQVKFSDGHTMEAPGQNFTIVRKRIGQTQR